MPRWTWGWEIGLQSARGVALLHSACSSFQLIRNLEKEKDGDAAARLSSTADALLRPRWSYIDPNIRCLILNVSCVAASKNDRIFILAATANICVSVRFTNTECIYLIWTIEVIVCAFFFFRHLWSVGNSEKNHTPALTRLTHNYIRLWLHTVGSGIYFPTMFSLLYAIFPFLLIWKMQAFTCSMHETYSISGPVVNGWCNVQHLLCKHSTTTAWQTPQGHSHALSI